MSSILLSPGKEGKMKKVQLFLLPYAGGNSFSFMRMIKYLNPEIEAITIEYSGRGSRKNEDLIDNYDDFLSDVVCQINRYRKNDLFFSILGYSMGSVIAFDICSQKLIVDKPIHAFFCAEGSLISSKRIRGYSFLPIEEFADKIIRLGGMNQRILNDEKALNDYIKLIKRDYSILEQYQYKNEVADCNSTIIYSPNDLMCVDMQEWTKLVSGEIDFFEVGDNHFFIKQEYISVANIINNSLLQNEYVI